MCEATCGAERYPKDRDIEVPRVRLAHHDESIEQAVGVRLVCVRGSRTSLGVDEHETACGLTGNPACTKLVDVPTQCRVDPVGQYSWLERRSAALWSDEPPHGQA
ncbi:hypothetical protein PI124_g23008 [Phytophthora idaei]|nr:hypothetical protein PI126_g2609 [Phytophthora idaei]KAG3231897.1 hypothetical protein PI124_g23008 [Phytophthora idaei]